VKTQFSDYIPPYNTQ